MLQLEETPETPPSSRAEGLLEKEMATHSSVLAWRIPGTEEPGGLLSMGSHPRGRGAWWAAVYGVAQSRTRLK